ncbi:inactive serine protease PAMR1 [Esox lucius]|uniref:Peptidase domain containing associated with muscle regeneration 1 n=1 Tax=Esox lucius TaxID=8010 RepID=A0A3P8YZG4_ESOLU|nr:inactive serine protease PAMR1 [Esox lucius]
MVSQWALATVKTPAMPSHLGPRHLLPLLPIFLSCLQGTAWPHDSGRAADDKCPSAEWNHMCRGCCEYHLIQCRCPSRGALVGYSVPCCRNELDQCDPCIIHPGCSLFENCKTCHNGTWEAQDDFFLRGRFCTDCRQGWAGGDCRTCGGVIHRAQGHVTLDSYPINARCEWRLQVEGGQNVELRFSMLDLEPDHNCRYDYVELRDGDHLSSPVIGRFCGNELPPPITTSGSKLHVLFVSDGYNNFDGFFATFQESSVAKTQKCVLPARPMNGNLLPKYGTEGELLAVQYLCHPPYSLIGSLQRTCLPNATWSGTAPACGTAGRGPVGTGQRGAGSDPVSRACPPPPRLHHGYVRLAVGSGGGPDTVEYFCDTSYVLRGGSRSTCLLNGSWSGPRPLCVRACREPKVSELVRQKVVKAPARPKVDNPIKPGLEPSPSGPPPSRGNPATGELPHGFHHLSTTIEYECISPLYQHYGSPRRTCLKTGKWSGRHVSCSPVCGRLPAAFSPGNITDIFWPWHTAVYLRSTSTRRPGPGLQGAPSEAPAPWQLMCSGALVTQLHVVVAAHCLLASEGGEPRRLDPADIRVVTGAANSGQVKALQRLRVSSVLAHPDFDPVTLDSDLAVVRLQDKAKISEWVLPVCLPRMQGGELTTLQGYTTGWLLAPDPPPRSKPGTDPVRSWTRMLDVGDVMQCERQFAQSGVHVTLTDNMLCALRHPLNPVRHCADIAVAQSPATKPLPGSAGGQRDNGVVWELLGLASFGREKWNCGPGHHTVHTRVDNFRDWIQENIR